MKTWLDAGLLEHMLQGCMTPAWYWMILRADGRIFGYTTHVADVAVASLLPGVPPTIGLPPGAVICVARAGFQATDVQMTDTLAPNNLDVTSVLGKGGMTQESIRAGLWSKAQIEIGWFNYADPNAKTNTTLMGTIGDITFGELTAKAELRPLSQGLEATMDGITSEMCDCKVFDDRCGVDPTPFIRTGTIAGAIGDREFTDPDRAEADGWWTKGELTFLSGRAAGQVVEIKVSTSDGHIELVEEIYPGFGNGDRYRALPGCNNLLWVTGDASDTDPSGDCKRKYDNARRFRGFLVPGMIAIKQYGGQSGA